MTWSDQFPLSSFQSTFDQHTDEISASHIDSLSLFLLSPLLKIIHVMVHYISLVMDVEIKWL